MIYELISKLPEQAKSTALYSLVGSLNASIIFGAQFIVRECDKHGMDVMQEICDHFSETRAAAEVATMSGVGVNRWEELVAMNTLRNELHTNLHAIRNRTNRCVAEELLPLNGTLKFMTTAVRTLPKAQVEELVAALNIDGLNFSSINAVYTADAEQRRQDLMAMSSRVLAVAEAIPEIEGCGDDEAFHHLSPDRQCALYGKLENALNKALNNVVLGVLQRRNTAALGDIPMIQAAINETKILINNSKHEMSV